MRSTPVLRLQRARGDRDVVEQAEAHRAVRLRRGGRAGAPRRGPTWTRPLRDLARQVDRAAGGEPRDLEALARDVGVGVEALRARGARPPRCAAQVRRGVHAQDLLVAGGAGRDRGRAVRGARRWRARRRRGGRGARDGPRPLVIAVARVHDHAGCPGHGHDGAWYPSAWSGSEARGRFDGLTRRGRDHRPRARCIGRGSSSACSRAFRTARGRPRPAPPVPARRRASRFHRVDLTDPTADNHVAELLVRERVDAVVHAAFRTQPDARHRARSRARDDRQPARDERVRRREGEAPGGGVEHDALRAAAGQSELPDRAPSAARPSRRALACRTASRWSRCSRAGARATRTPR